MVNKYGDFPLPEPQREAATEKKSKSKREQAKEAEDSKKKVAAAYTFDYAESLEKQREFVRTVKTLDKPPPVPVPFIKTTEQIAPDMETIYKNIKSLEKKLEKFNNEALKVRDGPQTLEYVLEIKPERLEKFQQYQIKFLSLTKQIESCDPQVKNNPELLKKIQQLKAPIMALEKYRSQLSVQALIKKDEKPQVEEKNLSKQLKPFKTPPPVPVPEKPTKKNIDAALKSLDKKIEELKNQALKLPEENKTLDRLLQTKPEMLLEFQQYQLDYSNLVKQIEAGGEVWKNKPEIVDKLEELEAPIKALQVYRTQLRFQTLKKGKEKKAKELEESEKQKSTQQAPSATESRKTPPEPRSAPLHKPPSRKPPPIPTTASVAASRKPIPDQAKVKQSAPPEIEPLQPLSPPAQTAEPVITEAVKRSFESKLNHCWSDLYVPALIKYTKQVKSPDDLTKLKEISPKLVELYTELKMLADRIPKDELTPVQQNKLSSLSRQIDKFKQYV